MDNVISSKTTKLHNFIISSKFFKNLSYILMDNLSPYLKRSRGGIFYKYIA